MKRRNLVMEKCVNKILRQVKKLQDDEKPAAKRKLITNKILRQISKLQHELDERKLIKNKMLRQISKLQHELDEQEKLEKMMKLEEEKEKERNKKNRAEYRRWLKLNPDKHVLCRTVRCLYDRDSTKSYSPKRVRKVKNYAQMAIDVFNETQPIKKYRVLDIISASSYVEKEPLVCLEFTAKADEYEGVKTFGAKICTDKPAEVRIVRLSST